MAGLFPRFFFQGATPSVTSNELMRPPLREDPNVVLTIDVLTLHLLEGQPSKITILSLSGEKWNTIHGDLAGGNVHPDPRH